MSARAPYRDPSLPVGSRVDDLLSRMTLEDKAGQLFHTMIGVGEDGSLAPGGGDFALPSAEEYVAGRRMTHVNVLAAPATASAFAQWHNRLQELAEATPLGIPVTVSSDPRHAFTDNPGAALPAGPFSQWPESLGLAALREESLIERFADTVRREYLAVGIRVALHPQIDLMTEPRWARATGTFGEDAALTGRLGAAYVRGLQGTGTVAREAGESGELGMRSVSAMVKHFPGGGPQLDGEDPHFPYGREQIYPGSRFEEHLAPFLDALAAGARQVMPYYGMPVGLVLGGESVEQVGFGFNRRVLTDVLRRRLGFDGIVCTDWGLVTDSEALGRPFPARAWGVERLSRHERVAKILDAGADQFGGEACPELVVDLVRSGRVAESRVDESVRRLLREKFELGLFDRARYVDAAAADRLVGAHPARAAGLDAQARSVVVLAQAPDGAAALPLRAGTRVYLDPRPASAGAPAGLSVVDRIEHADVAVLRLDSPYERRGPGFEELFHAGPLDFSRETVERVRALAARIPVVLAVDLERPAILTPLVQLVSAVVACFGVSDAALLTALSGQVRPEGRLPFDLPRSMSAVIASRSDVAFDTADPLFRFGHGLGGRPAPA